MDHLLGWPRNSANIGPKEKKIIPYHLADIADIQINQIEQKSIFIQYINIDYTSKHFLQLNTGIKALGILN